MLKIKFGIELMRSFMDRLIYAGGKMDKKKGERKKIKSKCCLN